MKGTVMSKFSIRDRFYISGVTKTVVAYAIAVVGTAVVLKLYTDDYVNSANNS
jgi:hypothetical protein